MSKIFNLILWDGDKINHIYFFVGDNNKNIQELISAELWNTITINDIDYSIINEFIYNDDSIIRIKEKLVKWTDINATIPEIYLFSLFEEKINSKIIFNQLVQDNFLELNNNRLNYFLKNIYFSDILNNEQISPERFIKKIKSLYSYSDFINLQNINFSKKNIIKKSIGVDAYYNKKHIFTCNPYELENEDETIINELTSITTQNKKSLIEYGDCLNNNIYICLAKDVIEKNIDSMEYLLKVYYPQLYNNFNVKDINDIESKRAEIIKNQDERLNNLDNIENKIKFLNKINNDFQIEYLNKGVKSIYITVHPISNMNIPLETIFKILNTSSNLPFIKYNSGNNLENIYRLYTANNISTNGKRIPSLYVNYNNKQVKIKSLVKSLARTKKIGLFILDDINEVFCELSPEGNIEIKIEFIEPQNIENINDIIKKTVNNEVLIQINNFTNDIGYKYTLFDNIYEENIEINNINYVYSFEYKKKINLNNYIGCLSPVFNINDGIISTTDDIINLTYKRVSSFQVMDSINFFITILQRNNIDLNTIKNKVKDNFNLTQEEAVNKVSEWQSQVSFQMEQYQNKKINVKDNPGFEIKLEQKIIDIYGYGYNNVMQLTIQHINNIKYIKFIDIYINALVAIITKNNEIPKDYLKDNCFTKKTADIEEDENLEDNDIDIDDLVKLQENNRSGKVEYIESDDEFDDELLVSDDEDDEDDDEEEIDFNEERKEKNTTPIKKKTTNYTTTTTKRNTTPIKKKTTNYTTTTSKKTNIIR